jgi:hypothetical protein
MRNGVRLGRGRGGGLLRLNTHAVCGANRDQGCDETDAERAEVQVGDPFLCRFETGFTIKTTDFYSNLFLVGRRLGACRVQFINANQLHRKSEGVGYPITVAGVALMVWIEG